MDFLLPLTIIGFVISFYSISEKYKKRNLSFKFSWFDKGLLSIIFLTLISVIFYQNYQIIQEPQLTYTLFNIEFTYAYLSSFVAFILAVIIVIYFISKLHSKKLNQKNKFIENALDNLKKKKYAELSADLDIFNNELLKKYKRPKIRHYYLLKYIKYWFVTKFGLENKNNITHKLKKKTNKKYTLMSYAKYKKDQKETYDRIGHLLNNFQSKDKNWKANLKSFFNKLRFIKNNQNKYCDLIDNFYNELANDSEYIKYLIQNNFNSSLALLKVQTHFNKVDLWDKIGRYLISNVGSKLYVELNDEYRGSRDLLNFLFENTSRCADFLTWKPIGDYVIEYIADQKKKEIDENNYQEDRYDIVKQNSPIYAGIRFFEVMVNEALEQSTADHMFLNYTGFFAEKILKNISYEDDARGEFANMYEYYLYEIFSNHNHWIDYISDYDKYKVKFYDDGHGPNIVQFAMFSFSYVMKDVFESTKLRDEFKSYLRGIFIEAYFNLANSQKQDMDKYANYFLKCIKERIVDYRRVNQPFIDFLKYPVQNYHDRNVWDRGVHYSSELRSGFIQFLDSLNTEANHNDI